MTASYSLDNLVFIKKFEATKIQVFDIKFSWDCNFIITSAYDKLVKIWQLDTTEEILSINNNGEPLAIEVSKDLK